MLSSVKKGWVGWGAQFKSDALKYFVATQWTAVHDVGFGCCHAGSYYVHFFHYARARMCSYLTVLCVCWGGALT